MTDARRQRHTFMRPPRCRIRPPQTCVGSAHLSDHLYVCVGFVESLERPPLFPPLYLACLLLCTDTCGVAARIARGYCGVYEVSVVDRRRACVKPPIVGIA